MYTSNTPTSPSATYASILILEFTCSIMYHSISCNLYTPKFGSQFWKLLECWEMCPAENVLDQFLPDSLIAAFMKCTIGLHVESWCFFSKKTEAYRNNRSLVGFPGAKVWCKPDYAVGRKRVYLSPSPRCVKLSFTEKVKDARYTFVLVHEWVLLKRVQPICQGHAERLYHLLRGGYCDARRGAEIGFTLGKVLIIVIEMKRFLLPHLLNYLNEFEGLTDFQANV